MEPVPVRGIFTEFHKAVELEESARAVIEHAVQNDAHPELVHFFHEAVKVLQSAEHWVDFKIVHRMVAVVGIALENRAQVNRVHPEALDVFQLVLDTREVPAEHVLARGLGAPRHELAYGMVTLRTAEPVGEYLVENSVFDPGRSEHCQKELIIGLKRLLYNERASAILRLAWLNEQFLLGRIVHTENSCLELHSTDLLALNLP